MVSSSSEKSRMALFSRRRLVVVILLTTYSLLLSRLVSFVFPNFNYSKLRVLTEQTQRKLVLDQIATSAAATVAVINDCDTTFLLQLVTSHVGNYELRKRIRREWNSTLLSKLKVRRIFLVGQTSPDASFREVTNNGKFRVPSMKMVMEEAAIEKDLLVGSFIEGYRNLTQKHLMGLRWVHNHCPRVTFVLKQDDDIYVDLFSLVNKLKKSSVAKKLQEGKSIYGRVLTNRSVIRTPESKWFVTKDELGIDTYPSFVSGWAYITTPQAIHKILQVEEQSSQAFWIDDVYVTGLLRMNTDLDLIDGSESFAVTTNFFDCCFMVTTTTNWESTWCDFIFGPLPPDSLRFRLIKNSERCYHSARCKVHAKSLIKTCVITRHELIANVPQFPQKRGRPLWEPIKLNL